MSIESTCDWCNASDKFRCKSKQEAFQCEAYKRKQAILKEINLIKKDDKMDIKQEPTDVESLAKLCTRQSRSVIAVIDALATRGSFKGEELGTIGMLRDQSTQIISLAERVLSETSAVKENPEILK